MHRDLRPSNRQAIRVSACLFIAVCALLALTSCADSPPQAPSPTGSPVVGELQTATPLPSRPARLPATKPYPTSTPPSWPRLGDDGLPSPLYLMSNSQVDRIEPHRKGRYAITMPGATSYDVSPIDGTVVLAAQGRLWLSRDGATYPSLLFVGLPNPEATDDCYNLRDPVWSPDGRYIAYADGGIRVWDTVLGERIDLAEIPVQTEEYLIPWNNYGTCYGEPRWSLHGDAVLFRRLEPDARTLMLATLSDRQVREIPSTWGVEHAEVAWSADGRALLFYCGHGCFAGMREMSPSFVRATLADPQTLHFVPLFDRVVPGYTYDPKNPPRATQPFQTPDGRILFFLEDACQAWDCSSYSLMEGVVTLDGFSVRVLHKDVLPREVYSVTWHESGNYVAFVVDRDEHPTIGLLRVDSGEIFTVLREDSPPYDLDNLHWGKQ